jgi:hypothetical protein
VRVIDDANSDAYSQGSTAFINHRMLANSDVSGSLLNQHALIIRNNRPSYNADTGTSDGGSVIQYMGHDNESEENDVEIVKKRINDNFDASSVGGDSQYGMSGIKPRALFNDQT